MVKVKICGITNPEDLGKAVFYGAWAVGFVFHKKSPRYVSPSRARKLVELLPPFVTPVGVFVNLREGAVKDILKFTGIHAAQFHGDEDHAYFRRFKDYKLIKAFRVAQDFDPKSVKAHKADAYLFDAYQADVYGGSGKTFNWDALKGIKFDRPVILSGGLTPENIRAGVETLRPYAVDVSSGLEQSPGIKDPKKIRDFFDALKSIPEA